MNIKKSIFYFAISGAVVIVLVIFFLFNNLGNTPGVVYTHDNRMADAYAAPAHTEAPPLIAVYITGAINNPGVYEVERGTRIAGIIEMAGGATHDADLEAVNLSRRASDEEHIIVPRIGESLPTAASPASPLIVNINTATREQLMQLPGVGEATANAIISHREQHGRFATAFDITNVHRIGERTFERLEPYITVD